MKNAAPTEMACKELVELVTDYLEEALPDEKQMRLEEHLVTCDGCKEYLRQMRSTITVSRKLSSQDLPEQSRDELLALFQKWKGTSSR